MEPQEICRSCGFWREGCVLIRESRLAELLDAAPCRPWEWVERWVSRFVRFLQPNAVSHREDLLQDLQLHLRQPSFRLPPSLVPDSQHFRSYLRSVVLNRASDFLRHERIVPKVRCGACLYRGVSGKCTKALGVDKSGREIPHPHYEKAVDPGTNPGSLEPPCEEFFWRYRPLRLEEAGRPAPPGRDPRAEERSAVLALALAELMREGPQGRRRALILREHFLRGKTVVETAKRLGLNERTVRRNIQAALEALRKIISGKLKINKEDLL